MRGRFVLLAAGLVAVILAARLAVQPAANSTPAAKAALATLYACRRLSNGDVFLWRSCPKGYTKFTWPAPGPKGATGATGPAGLTGPQGAAGPAGPSFAATFKLTLPGLRHETCKAATSAGKITAITCVSTKRHA